MMQLLQISDAVNGQLLGDDVSVSGITTDTRSDCVNQLFVALKGINFDAHDFLLQAQRQGAAAALVEHAPDIDIPLVKVNDTQVALSKMAAWWRQQFVLPVVGVTGSVGKTTVKEMLAHIFAELGEGLVTKGNLNNEIGVPLTLMRLKQNDLYAIIEMGMNHSGEIARLTAMTQPTIALVNNAAPAHLENLGSLEAIAQAKGEIFQGLSIDGTAVINVDDAFADSWKQQTSNYKQLTFGLSASADVTADYQIDGSTLILNVTALNKKFKVRLSALGVHSVKNALAAIAVSMAANIPTDLIADGLQKYRTIAGRLTSHKINSLSLIDDTYNANPASMNAAIDVLAQYTNQTTYLIVGDMAELGDEQTAAHQAVGQYADQQGIDCLYACGEFATQAIEHFSREAYSFATQAELLVFLSDRLPTSGVCLVKGSRSAKMEQVVNFIDKKNRNNKGVATC